MRPRYFESHIRATDDNITEVRDPNMLGLGGAAVDDVDVPTSFFAIGILAADFDQLQKIAIAEGYAAAVGEHRHNQEQQYAQTEHVPYEISALRRRFLIRLLF